jgi:hypothetical protein
LQEISDEENNANINSHYQGIQMIKLQPLFQIKEENTINKIKNTLGRNEDHKEIKNERDCDRLPLFVSCLDQKIGKPLNSTSELNSKDENVEESSRSKQKILEG